MINIAYEFFMTNFFSGDIPSILQPISQELSALFAIGSVLMVVGTVIGLMVFFFRFITGLGLRR